MISVELIAQLKRHEGFYSEPYVCPAGAATIGYGTNLEAHPHYIPYENIRTKAECGALLGRDLVNALKKCGLLWSKAIAEAALREEVGLCISQLERRCPAYVALLDKGDTVRAEILVNMCFNMGIGRAPTAKESGRGLLSFVNTLSFVEKGKYGQAADNMLQSKWATQVKTRAVELAKQMREGKYQS